MLGVNPKIGSDNLISFPYILTTIMWRGGGGGGGGGEGCLVLRACAVINWPKIPS